MLKPKQLFIIIYVNVCVKRVYPQQTNNNILFRYGNIQERQFSVRFLRTVLPEIGTLARLDILRAVFTVVIIRFRM
jgi:hypothetical protein